MKRSTILAFIIVGQLALSFISQTLILRIIGAGIETDVFIAAQAVPSVLVAVFTTALQSVWLPRLSSNFKDSENWHRNIELALGQAAIMSIFSGILIFISSHFWLPLLFDKFNGEQIKDMLIINNIMLVLNPFTLFSVVITLALRTIDRFYTSELINLLALIVSTMFLPFFLKEMGIWGAVLLLVVRSLVVIFLQLKLVRWPKIAFLSGFHDKSSWSLMNPILLSSSLYKTSPLYDKYWVAKSEAGALTVFNLSQSLSSALSAVLEKSICTPAIAKFGFQAATGDYTNLRRTYRAGVAINFTIIFVISLLMLIFQDSFENFIERLLLDREGFGSVLWMFTFILLGQTFAASSGALPVAVFHSLGDTKTHVQKVGLPGFFLSLVVKGCAYLTFGVKGLCIAISTYYLLNFLVTVWLCEKKLNSIFKDI